MSRNSSQKVPGLAFVGIGATLLLLSLVGLFLIENKFVQQQQYQMGRCTITAKGVIVHQQNTTISYTPHFEFTVRTTDGRSYTASGYNGLNTSSSNHASSQAIVNQYNVGQTYPCWYDPSDPTQAVLVRQSIPPLLFIPAFFLLLGGIFGIVGVLVLLGRVKMGSRS